MALRRALLIAILGACGGAPSATAPRTAPVAVAPAAPQEEPEADYAAERVEVAADCAREHAVLRVDIVGTARGHDEGEALEVPGNWKIAATTAGGQELKRLVTGPGLVQRDPVGNGASFDVVVRFAVYFESPKDQTVMHLRVLPPGDSERTLTVPVPAP